MRIQQNRCDFIRNLRFPSKLYEAATRIFTSWRNVGSTKRTLVETIDWSCVKFDRFSTRAHSITLYCRVDRLKCNVGSTHHYAIYTLPGLHSVVKVGWFETGYGNVERQSGTHFSCFVNSKSLSEKFSIRNQKKKKKRWLAVSKRTQNAKQSTEWLCGCQIIYTLLSVFFIHQIKIFARRLLLLHSLSSVCFHSLSSSLHFI